MLTVSCMREIERLVSCPFCKAPTRVTGGELIDKRGFCASCNARFDLVPEMFIADGPHRSVTMVASSLPALAPTGKMSVTREAGEREVITVSSARPAPVMLGLFLVFWFGVLAVWYAQAIASPSLVLLGFPLLHVAAGLAIARKVLRDVRGREQLSFGDDALIIEQRGALLTRTRRVRYDDIVAVRIEAQPRSMWERNSFMFSSGSPEHRVLLLRSGVDPEYVASGLGHHADAAAWLAARIEATARDGRQREHLDRGTAHGLPGSG
jgi:hypothetical protein